MLKISFREKGRKPKLLKKAPLIKQKQLKPKNLNPGFRKNALLPEFQRPNEKAPRVKKIPGAPDTDNVLQKVPAIVSTPPTRGGIDPRNLKNGKLPNSPSLTGQQPARNKGQKAIPGRRFDSRKQAAERLFKRGLSCRPWYYIAHQPAEKLPQPQRSRNQWELKWLNRWQFKNRYWQKTLA